ncbi:MAG: hypothetical protein QF464_13895 [Myxococcota bacterium]|nr:hypothetical protein [Myxococcota bacterium]
MTRALALAALLGAACAAQKPPTKPAEVAPAAVATTSQEEATPDDCVERCTQQRRMHAMAWEAIVAACERECAQGEED